MRTLEEVRASSRDVLTPADVAPVLGCDPHYIRVAARQCPERLGFPVVLIGNRTKIPRIAFIKFMEGVGRDDDRL